MFLEPHHVFGRKLDTTALSIAFGNQGQKIPIVSFQTFHVSQFAVHASMLHHCTIIMKWSHYLNTKTSIKLPFPAPTPFLKKKKPDLVFGLLTRYMTLSLLMLISLNSEIDMVLANVGDVKMHHLQKKRIQRQSKKTSLGCLDGWRGVPLEIEDMDVVVVWSFFLPQSIGICPRTKVDCHCYQDFVSICLWVLLFVCWIFARGVVCSVLHVSDQPCISVCAVIGCQSIWDDYTILNLCIQ